MCTHKWLAPLAVLLGLSGVAAAQTVVTTFEPAGTTAPGVWYQSDVRPGGAAVVVDLGGFSGDLEANAPLPTGAARLVTDLSNTAKAEVAVSDSYGVAEQIIPTLQVGYSWHKRSSAGQSLNAATALKLTFYNPVCDETPDGDCLATLIYEPYQNGFGNQPTVDLWQRSDMDAHTGSWWINGGFGAASGGGGCGGPTCPTLSQWLGSLSPDFAQAELIEVSVGVGSYNPGQDAFFDEVTVSHSAGSGYSAAYDFEPAPAYGSLGECISALVALNCDGLSGRDRAACARDQRDLCQTLF